MTWELTTACRTGRHSIRTGRHSICGGYRCPCKCHIAAIRACWMAGDLAGP